MKLVRSAQKLRNSRRKWSWSSRECTLRNTIPHPAPFWCCWQPWLISLVLEAIGCGSSERRWHQLKQLGPSLGWLECRLEVLGRLTGCVGRYWRMVGGWMSLVDVPLVDLMSSMTSFGDLQTVARRFCCFPWLAAGDAVKGRNENWVKWKWNLQLVSVFVVTFRSLI